MKTIHNLRQVFPVIFLSSLFLLFAANTNAQNNRKKEKERNEYRRDNNRDEKKHYHNGYTSREYSYEDSYRHDDRKSYRPEYPNYRKHESRCYTHPVYGRVYQSFDYNPIVFHQDRNHYYYYGKNFYTYRRGVGYCVVEPPRNVYFRTLPVDCEKVYVNGSLFFRHGELFFQLSPRGYSIVTSPVQVRISAHF